MMALRRHHVRRCGIPSARRAGAAKTTSATRSPASRCRRCRAGATCRSGCWVPASTAHSWRRNSACRSPRLALRPGYAVPCALQTRELNRQNAAARHGVRQRRRRHRAIATRASCSVPMQQQFINLRRGSPGPLPPPVDNIHALWTAGDMASSRRCGCRSSAMKTVRHGCKRRCVKPMPTRSWSTARSLITAARLRSFEIVAGVQGDVVKG